MLEFPSFLPRLVSWCHAHALAFVAVAILTALGLGYFDATHIAMDTDQEHLLSPNLDWRKREAHFDELFPQNSGLLAIVIDGDTPDDADDAAAALLAKLETRPDLFKYPHRPDGGPFFEREGLLYLKLPEIEAMMQQIIAAQPMIGTLAADPSLRGLLDALGLALEGVKRGEAKLEDLDRPAMAFAQTAQAVLAGHDGSVSWQTLITGEMPRPEELRRFILTQPVLDYEDIQPGAKASGQIRAFARDLNLTPEHGVRARLTGPVALSDEEFGSVAEGAGVATALSLGAVCLILFLALKSWRLIVPILITLLTGLIVTGAYAIITVGALNLISVAFAVLFIGIAVDFGIQFGVRFRDEHHRIPETGAAMEATAQRVGGTILLASTSAAVGFLSFVPTAYTGVSELGIISGGSMVIAGLLNLTLLPALLTLFRPGPEPSEIGFAKAAPLDAFLLRRRRAVLIAAGATMLISLALCTHLSFDFNPLHLKDPHTESMQTLNDLMKDPHSTPFTIDVLAPSPEAADALAKKIEKLPTVLETANIMGFIPDQQEAKLALLQDTSDLLGPTLTPVSVAPPPTAAALHASIRKFLANLNDVLMSSDSPMGQFAAALQDAEKLDDRGLMRLQAALVGTLPTRLHALAVALSAEPVTYDTLPVNLKRDWVAPDGEARISVFPKGDSADNKVLVHFVKDVRTLIPDATGAPVSIQESGHTISSAFVTAGILALVAITLLMALVLRHVLDVALVMMPLILASALTLGTTVLIGLPINFANIITLPLLLGIGVSFALYFVRNWRAGQPHPLQSATARAVLFSALTTMSAFGSLALSHHPGTADMGILLAISLTYTLLATLFVLPAALGNPIEQKPDSKNGNNPVLKG